LPPPTSKVAPTSVESWYDNRITTLQKNVLIEFTPVLDVAIVKLDRDLTIGAAP